MKILKRFGFIITSLDEEVGVIHQGDDYLDQRYGDKTVNLIDKLFVHGNYDYKNLIRKFYKYKKKIVISGNPRFDFGEMILKSFSIKITRKKEIIYYCLQT